MRVGNVGSISLAKFLLLYDGKFYNVNEAFRRHGGYFLDYPGWWGVKNGHLFTSDGIRVDLFAVEKVAPHRMVLKRYYRSNPGFLQLNNLPRKPFTTSEPVALAHPEVAVVLQPTYDYIGEFADTLAEARSGEYYGLIDRTGAEWLPLVYDMVFPFRGRSFTYGQRAGQCYRINARGEEVETLPYGDFIDARGAYLLVKDEQEKVGAIDREGNLVVPCAYEMVFPQSDEIFRVTKDGKTGLVARGGKEIFAPEYDELIEIRDGLYKVILAGKEGIIDPATGQYLLEPKYAYIHIYDRYYQAEQYDRFQLFDRQFQPVALPDYELMVYLGEGYLGVEENGIRGIVDTRGEVLVPLAYENVQLTSAGVLVRQGGKWGLIDWEGAEILPLDYDRVQLENELFKVKKDGYWGLLDRDGRELLPAEYDELRLDYADQPATYCKVYQNGQARLIDFDENDIIATAHDEIGFPRPLFSGSAELWYAFEDDGKHGYLDDAGEVAIPAEYDYYFFFEPTGYAIVQRAGKYGVIDTENRVVVPCIFDTLHFQVDQPVVVVRYAGFYGLIENPVYSEP